MPSVVGGGTHATSLKIQTSHIDTHIHTYIHVELLVHYDSSWECIMIASAACTGADNNSYALCACAYGETPGISQSFLGSLLVSSTYIFRRDID